MSLLPESIPELADLLKREQEKSAPANDAASTTELCLKASEIYEGDGFIQDLEMKRLLAVLMWPHI